MKKIFVIATTISAVLCSCGNQNDIRNEFLSPSAEYRPHARMWMPQAAIDETELRAQIKDIADAGFGDVEIVGFSMGRKLPGSNGPAIDEKLYAWGSEKWTETMTIILDAAKDNGIKATFTVGPAWPIATPLLKEDSEGVEIQLACDRTDVRNRSYSADLPNDWFAVVAGKRNEKGDIEISSLTDITNLVSDNRIDWTAPDNSGLWSIFVYRNEKVGEKKNGFMVVDHFSLAGTQAVLDYYQDVFGALEKLDLLKYMNGLFGDSLEYRASVDWTLGFTEVFRQLKGYDITPYLPALHNGVAVGGGGIFGGGFGKEALGGAGDKILNDYYSVLTHLFCKNHLEPMQKFLEDYGMNLRYQTAYGKYMEQASTSMYVGIPEGEMMMIRNSFDNIRAQAGAVHVMGRKEYNAELQAEGGKNHAQSWQNLLFFVQRTFAAGVNNITLHGYTANGRFHGEGNENGHLPGLSWPGYEGFGRDGFSNNWNVEPLWDMAPVYTGFISRNGFILKQGKPKIDLAVFRESYWDNASFTGRDGDIWYKDGGLLQDEGYSFDFLSLSNLQTEKAEVSEGRLFADGPAYKALIIDQSLDTKNEPVTGARKIRLEAAQRILELAQQGLPVVYISELPSEVSDFGGSQDGLKKVIDMLEKLPNVRKAHSFADVPATLSSMGIQPDASYKQEADAPKLINIQRSDDDIDYFYIYNRGYNSNSGNQFPWGYGQEHEVPYGEVTVDVSFNADGQPYLMNAWDGSITPVTDYKVKNGRTIIPLTLEGNESVIIAFDRGRVLKATRKAYDKNFTGSKTMVLDGWKLIVESWTPGSSPSETAKTSYDVEIDSLMPWPEIEGLENVSGKGTYTTSFDMKEGWKDGTGAIIDLGDVNYSYRLWINDREVTASQTNTRIDIGPFLQKGENSVKVEVFTTLNNVIKGMSARTSRTTDPYGLLGNEGEVRIETYYRE